MVKFQKGLDPQIQSTIATMPYGRSLDTSPKNWYKVAKTIDQNREANEAFQSASCPTLCPASRPVSTNPVKTLPYITPTLAKAETGLKKDPPLPICYRCRKTSHRVLDCPDKYDIRTSSLEELEMEIMVRKDMEKIAEPIVESEKDFVQDNE